MAKYGPKPRAGVRADVRVAVRITDAEAEQLDRAAAAQGMTRSEYARLRLLGIEPVRPQERAG